MEEKVLKLAALARDLFRQYGLNVTGVRYFLPNNFQCKINGICMCFEATTHDPHFFGEEYQNAKRIALIDQCYQAFGETAYTLFPNHQICFDVYVRLKLPYILNNSRAITTELHEGCVDVTSDNKVSFVTIDQLIADGSVENGAMLHEYCEKYNLPHALKHGRHYISPDSATVEAIEALIESGSVNSILEIGGGVGIVGRAAERAGIKDLTFVDKSPLVCDYLRQHFSFPVIESDLMDLDLRREWDVICVGTPYELNPWFLEKRGAELSKSAPLVIVQSGCPAFFDFEHDWLMGQEHFSLWPWWRASQTLQKHYPSIWEYALDWQLCAIGTREDPTARIALSSALTKRGFLHPRMNYLKL